MGTLLGIIALFITLIAFIPLLGFLNWVAIPLSILLLIICAIIRSDKGKNLCLIAIVIGLVRLLIGGGVF